MSRQAYLWIGYRMILFSYLITFISVIALSLDKAIAGIYYIVGWAYLFFGLYLSRGKLSRSVRRFFGRE